MGRESAAQARPAAPGGRPARPQFFRGPTRSPRLDPWTPVTWTEYLKQGGELEIRTKTRPEAATIRGPNKTYVEGKGQVYVLLGCIGGSREMVPLIYVVMKRRRKRDYLQVFGL